MGTFQHLFPQRHHPPTTHSLLYLIQRRPREMHDGFCFILQWRMLKFETSSTRNKVRNVINMQLQTNPAVTTHLNVNSCFCRRCYRCCRCRCCCSWSFWRWSSRYSPGFVFWTINPKALEQQQQFKWEHDTMLNYFKIPPRAADEMMRDDRTFFFQWFLCSNWELGKVRRCWWQQASHLDIYLGMYVCMLPVVISPGRSLLTHWLRRGDVRPWWCGQIGTTSIVREFSRELPMLGLMLWVLTPILNVCTILQYIFRNFP